MLAIYFGQLAEVPHLAIGAANQSGDTEIYSYKIIIMNPFFSGVKFHNGTNWEGVLVVNYLHTNHH